MPIAQWLWEKQTWSYCWPSRWPEIIWSLLSHPRNREANLGVWCKMTLSSVLYSDKALWSHQQLAVSMQTWGTFSPFISSCTWAALGGSDTAAAAASGSGGNTLPCWQRYYLFPLLCHGRLTRGNLYLFAWLKVVQWIKSINAEDLKK